MQASRVNNKYLPPIVVGERLFNEIQRWLNEPVKETIIGWYKGIPVYINNYE